MNLEFNTLELLMPRKKISLRGHKCFPSMASLQRKARARSHFSKYFPDARSSPAWPGRNSQELLMRRIMRSLLSLCPASRSLSLARSWIM